MSDQINICELLTELSTNEQQLLSGGYSYGHGGYGHGGYGHGGYDHGGYDHGGPWDSDDD